MKKIVSNYDILTDIKDIIVSITKLTNNSILRTFLSNTKAFIVSFANGFMASVYSYTSTVLAIYAVGYTTQLITSYINANTINNLFSKIKNTIVRTKPEPATIEEPVLTPSYVTGAKPIEEPTETKKAVEESKAPVEEKKEAVLEEQQLSDSTTNNAQDNTVSEENKKNNEEDKKIEASFEPIENFFSNKISSESEQKSSSNFKFW